MANKFYSHADYITHKDLWETIEDLLKGEHACLTSPKYLWVHPIEDAARQCDAVDRKNAELDRALREQRTQYVNYIKMVSQRFVSLIMKGGLAVDEKTASMLGDLQENMDGQGNSLEEMAKKLSEHLVQFGTFYLLTDTQTVFARNLQEQQDMEVRPYWILLHPLSVKDWQIGADGSYEAIRYEYMLMKPRPSLDSEPFLAYYTTVAAKMSTDSVYTIKTYVHTDDKYVPINYHPECATSLTGINTTWTLVDTAEVPELDGVPLACPRLEEGCLEPVVPIALKIFNKQSELDNILHNQGYERVFIFSDTLGPAMGADGKPIDDSAKEVKISTNSLVVIPDPNGKVEKLDPTDPQGLTGSLQQDIMDMFRIAFNISRIVKESSEVAEGADTKREVKEELMTRIEGIRNKVIQGVNKGLNDFALYQNSTYDGEVSFAQELTELDLNDLLNFARSLADRLSQYPTVRKELDKKMVGMLHLPKEDELFKEIETTEIKEPTVEAGVAGVGGALEKVANGKKQPVSKGNPQNGKGRR